MTIPLQTDTTGPTPTGMTGLPSGADVAGAAQALVDGCLDLSCDDDRVELLDRICSGLGDELYPTFVHVLWMIGRHGDHHAREVIARSLVHALRTGRLPSGRRGAWGTSRGSSRSLGPIEYLCTWYAQQDGASTLSLEQFQSGTCSLMELVAASADARLLYCEKLLADADDPIGGIFSRTTRAGIRALAESWKQGATPGDASTQFLHGLEKDDHSLAMSERFALPLRPIDD
jgi:hypothetical protein